ncbi:MAG: hypothetical protein BWY02_00451 [bacterium ADurb.Bin157]|jgi:hypothetical protein|nr:MAG: hypothetical protein BWY02_00451 [bacterium ADurb.Bin157]
MKQCMGKNQADINLENNMKLSLKGLLNLFLVFLLLFACMHPAVLFGLDDVDIVATDDEFVEDFEEAEDEMGEIPEGEVSSAPSGSEAYENDSGEAPLEKITPDILAKLSGSFRGLLAAKKYNRILDDLALYDDPDRYEELARYSLLSYIGLENWNRVNAATNAYERAQGHDADLLAYARGLYYMNIKKPDYAKATGFLKKAINGKSKEYKGLASSAYNSCLLKQYWYLAVVALLAVPLGLMFAVKLLKRKKVKRIEINIDEPVQHKPAQTKPEPKPVQPKPIEPKPVIHYEPIVPGEKESEEPLSNESSVCDVSNDPAEASAQEDMSVQEEEPVISEEHYEDPLEAARRIENELKKSKQIIQSKTAVEPPVNKTRESEPDNLFEKEVKDREDKENAIKLIKNEKNSQIDPEIEIIWETLSKKALESHIEPLTREEIETNVFASANKQDISKQFYTDDLSLDLSEEALREDLVGKLKMLAISDGELRELLAQKNPAHIPAIIEYIMTRPEPVRLAFIAREIGHYRDAAVIDTLETLLYNNDERVVLAAIQGLENSRHPSAVLLLCGFIRSDIPLLAQAARSALTKFGAVLIIEAMQNLQAHSDEKIKEAAIFVLSRMKGSAVEDLLKKMLLDKSEEIRCKAILAMSFQKNPLYAETLREFFRTATGKDKSLARKAIVYLQSFASKNN